MNQQSPIIDCANRLSETAKVAIIVLTWNSRRHIDGCLSSLLQQSCQDFVVHVYDSCSSDDTVAYIRSHYPQVVVTSLAENLGYRRGNALAMLQAQSPYVVICNDDVEVEPNWLAELVRCLDEDPTVGMATPLILDANRQDVVNTAGNTLHISGVYGPRGKGDDRRRHTTAQDLATVSGCCFIIRRDLVNITGGFSLDFDALATGWHASYEDVDLSWRIQLLGYSVRFVPTAVMVHHYTQPSMSPGRYATYEWGRYITLLRNYKPFTLLCLLPLLVIVEALMWAYAVMRGMPYVLGKAHVMGWLATHPQQIMAMRRRVQRTVRVPDSQVVARMSHAIHIDKLLGGGLAGQVLDTLLATLMSAYSFALLTLLRLCGR